MKTARGNDATPTIQPYQKPLVDRLTEIATRNKVHIDDIYLPPEEEKTISAETVGNWFYTGSLAVWTVIPPYSLLFFSLDNPIRRGCVNIMLLSWFDRVILLSIILNALFIAADNPLNDGQAHIFDTAEIVFNSIFTIEFVIKIIALGGTAKPAGYFRDNWNRFSTMLLTKHPKLIWHRLDFTVLVLGWLPTFLAAVGGGNVANFSFIRAIRILKMLKTLNNVPGLKRLVKAVLDAMPRIISVFYILAFIFLLFGICGTQMFKGDMRQRCYPENVQDTYGLSYVPLEKLCRLKSRSGYICPTKTPKCTRYYPGTNDANANLNPFFHYDNTPTAFLSILVVISQEGWSDMMYDLMDANGPATSLYFVFLVFVGSFFIINLVIAVIYHSYCDTLEQSEAGSQADVSSKQRRKNRRAAQPTLLQQFYDQHVVPQIVYDALQSEYYLTVKRVMRMVVESNYFNWGLVVCILFNVAVLSMESNGASDELQDFIDKANLVCTIVFAIELVVRMIATGIRAFFQVGFNILDFVIVVVSLSEYGISNGSSAVSAFRTLRVLRTFKLLNRWQSLQQLVRAILKSGPGLGYFCIILFLYIFVCALAGMSFFAGVLSDKDYEFGTHRANYDTLFNAFLTTFQIVTGENWNDVLFRSMEYNPALGSIFFVIVYTMGNMIVLNLFLAILLENFSDGNNRDQISYYEVLETKGDFQMFLESVSKFLGVCGDKCAEWCKLRTFKCFACCKCSHLLPSDWQTSAAEQEYHRATSTPTINRRGMMMKTHSLKAMRPDDQPGAIGKSSVFRSISFDGWDDDKDRALAVKFLTNDAYRMSILSELPLGHFRRGNQHFNECFLGCELVDVLLDHKIVYSVLEAEQLCQELIHRRKIIQVYVDNDKPAPPIRAQNSNLSEHDNASTMSKQSRASYIRKISRAVETHFADDRSLYRLSDQGEQVTEWLVTSAVAKNKMNEVKKTVKLEEKTLMLRGKSFGLFSSKNPFRRFCVDLTSHKYFEGVVLFMIICSSIFLALDEPNVQADSDLGQALYVTDVFFTAFFVLEMLLKMVATCVIGAPRAYFTRGWNILDFVIVLISILSLALKSLDLSFLKAIRALRALRPLRMVSRSPGMKAVVTAIVLTVPPMMNFVMVVSIFLLMFAILGGSLFRGLLFYCRASGDWEASDDEIYANEFRYELDKDQCFGNTTNSDGMSVKLQWVSENANFDSIGNSLLTLFELTSMENWPGLMYPAMDIAGKDKHPVEDESWYYALFFVCFIIVGAFFITNLFIGVIVHKFNKAKQFESDSVFLSKEQQQWLSDLKLAMKTKPQQQSPVPGEDELCGLKRKLYYISINPIFTGTMDVIIVLNILVMTISHFNEPLQLTRALWIIDIIFVMIFLIEILIRFFAVHPRKFIKNYWNIFDSIIVIAALYDAFAFGLVFNVTLLRVLRLGRIFRLIKNSKNMLILIKTLAFSLPSLINVGSLLLLSFFVFAVLGMNFFGKVRQDGVWITAYNNFEHFGTTMLLLFRCITGENWNGIMHYLANEGYHVAIPYFLFFLVSNTYMMINLFVAVILENFEEALVADPDKVQQKNFEEFIGAWAKLHDELNAEDNDRLPCYALVKLVNMLKPPLGIKGMPEVELGLGDSSQRNEYRKFVISFVRSLDLKEDSKGRVYFVDVLAALVRRIQRKHTGNNILTTMTEQQKEELLYQMRKMCKGKTIKKLERKMKDEIFTEIDLTVEFNAVMSMQAMYRGRVARAMLRRLIEAVHAQQSATTTTKRRKSITLKTLAKFAKKPSLMSSRKYSNASPTDNPNPNESFQSLASFYDATAITPATTNNPTGNATDEPRVPSMRVLSLQRLLSADTAKSVHTQPDRPPIETLEIEVDDGSAEQASGNSSVWTAPVNFLKKRMYGLSREPSALTMSSWASSSNSKSFANRDHTASVPTVPPIAEDSASDPPEENVKRVISFERDEREEWPASEIVSSRSLGVTGQGRFAKDAVTARPAPMVRSNTLSALTTGLHEMKSIDRGYESKESGDSDEIPTSPSRRPGLYAPPFRRYSHQPTPSTPPITRSNSRRKTLMYVRSYSSQSLGKASGAEDSAHSNSLSLSSSNSPAVSTHVSSTTGTSEPISDCAVLPSTPEVAQEDKNEDEEENTRKE